MTIRRSSGFTLMEILIVITIIAFLFAFLGPKIVRYMGQVDVKKMELRMGAIKEALMNYRLLFGAYPTSKEGLKALTDESRFKGKGTDVLLKEEDITDILYNRAADIRFKNKYKQYELIWIGSGTEEDPQLTNGE